MLLYNLFHFYKATEQVNLKQRSIMNDGVIYCVPMDLCKQDAEILIKMLFTSFDLNKYNRHAVKYNNTIDKDLDYYLKPREKQSLLKYCVVYIINNNTLVPIGITHVFYLNSNTELGFFFIFKKKYQKKGYGTRFGKLLIESVRNSKHNNLHIFYQVTHAVNFLIGIVDKDNIGSNKVFKKLGFKASGPKRIYDFDEAYEYQLEIK